MIFSKSTLFNSIQGKMKNMLKTSKFDRLHFDDPKKQVLAEELMQREAQKGTFFNYDLILILDAPLLENTLGSMNIFVNDTKEEITYEIDSLQKRVKNLELNIVSLKPHIYDIAVAEITRLVKIFRNQQKVSTEVTLAH